MRRFVAFVGWLACCLVVPGCAITGDGAAGGPPPEPELEVAHEFGPLVYRIHAESRVRWERVLDLQRRLYVRKMRKVEEDDLHRLYNESDPNDDDILDPQEVENAFQRMKLEYEQFLVKQVGI